MVGIRFGGGRDELLTFMQYLGVITPPYSTQLIYQQILRRQGCLVCLLCFLISHNGEKHS